MTTLREERSRDLREGSFRIATIEAGAVAMYATFAVSRSSSAAAAEFRRINVRAAAGEVEDELELAQPEIGIHLVRHGADELEREEHHREVDAVRELHRHHVAAADARAAQELGAALHLVFQFAIRDPAARIAESLVCRERFCLIFQDFKEGRVRPQPAL